MNDALIGHTGFIGTTLLRQRSFQHLYRSTNIDEIRGREFELVVCAGAPAQKWIANREPERDRRNIEHLMQSLGSIRCRQFILISTVDVFQCPIGVDESTAVDEGQLEAYGLHRRMLEKFIEQRFAARLIVRLPALVGPGLRKNIVYDLRHGNALESIDSRALFQFYPVVNLWYDIEIGLAHKLALLHLTAEPVSVAEVALEGFGRSFPAQSAHAAPARYDIRSRYVDRFRTTPGSTVDRSLAREGNGHYHYSRRESIMAIRTYAQPEPSNS